MTRQFSVGKLKKIKNKTLAIEKRKRVPTMEGLLKGAYNLTTAREVRTWNVTFKGLREDHCQQELLAKIHYCILKKKKKKGNAIKILCQIGCFFLISSSFKRYGD